MDPKTELEDIMARSQLYLSKLNTGKGIVLGLKIMELQLKTLEVYHRIGVDKEYDSEIEITVIEKRFEKIIPKNDGNTTVS